MKILKDRNELRKVVEQHAKYQKVMLIFDDSVANVEIFDIHNLVRESCVFNKIHISGDLKELNNGYKLLIFLCGADNFLKQSQSLDLNDFVCVFVPTGAEVLPFYLKNFKAESGENFLLLNGGRVDISLFGSVIFNEFFAYFCSVVGAGEKVDFLKCPVNEINQKAEIDLLNDLRGVRFFDLECVGRTGIDYADLVLVDYLLVSAILVFLNSVHAHALQLTDIYKVARENYDLLDKFYSMATNEYLLELTNLNFFNLNKACEKTKNELLFLLKNHFEFDLKKVNEITKKLSAYLKDAPSLLGFLFLYDIFPAKF